MTGVVDPSDVPPSDLLFGGSAGAGIENAGALGVRGASGRQEPFDRERVRASVERARSAAMARPGGDAGAAHERDDLAEEIADIVAFTLEARAGGGGTSAAVVESAAVADLVERALIEVGAAATARAYIVERDRRERGEGRGRGARGTAAGGAPRMPTVRSATGSAPFAAHRIVAALVQETGLVPEEAEAVADRVGESLLACGLGSVSTTLVRELVSHELLALGRPDALRRHEAIGIPRHDLGRLFQSARPAARPFEQLVSRNLIERWTRADLLSESVVEAHARADLHVVGLGSAHLPLARAVPARLLAGAAGEGNASRVGCALAAAGTLARGVEGGLLIEDAEWLVESAGDAGVDALLDGLAAVGNAAGASVDLAFVDGGQGPDPARDAGLIRVCRGLFGGRGPGPIEGPRVFADFAAVASALSGAADSPVAAALEEGLVRGQLVPVWSARPAAGATRSARWAGPGLWRGAGDEGALALDAACALNLPRLARRAGPWREDAFLEALHGLMRTAVRGLMERAEMASRARRTHGSTVAERGLMAVAPVGLFEALSILGDGLARAEQGARILGFMGESAARWAAMLMPRGGELTIALCGGGPGAPGRRFAEADARAGGLRQPRLFEDLPTPEEEVQAAYRAGFGDLSGADTAPRLERRAAALAVLVAGVRTGELLPDAPDADPREAAFPREPGDVGGHPPADSERGSHPAPGREPLEAILANHPHLAAWARFSADRASDPAAGGETTETTLF